VKTRKARFTLKATTGNSKNDSTEATTVPTRQNAENPMNNDNALLPKSPKSVKITHDA
jgi:hypothetical protein